MAIVLTLTLCHDIVLLDMHMMKFKGYRDAYIASKLAPHDSSASELVEYFRDGERSTLAISSEERTEAERLAMKHLSVMPPPPSVSGAFVGNFGSNFSALGGEEGGGTVITLIDRHNYSHFIICLKLTEVGIVLLSRKEGSPPSILNMLLSSFGGMDAGNRNSFPPIGSILLSVRRQLKLPSSQALVCSLLNRITVRPLSLIASLMCLILRNLAKCTTIVPVFLPLLTTSRICEWSFS